jgi:hypothetical protein
VTAISLCCEVCGAPTGADPHFPHDTDCTGVDDPCLCYCTALTCIDCCPVCNPCLRCDGLGHLSCDHHGTGGDCTCPLWECPECAGSGIKNASSTRGGDGADPAGLLPVGSIPQRQSSTAAPEAALGLPPGREPHLRVTVGTHTLEARGAGDASEPGPRMVPALHSHNRNARAAGRNSARA